MYYGTRAARQGGATAVAWAITILPVPNRPLISKQDIVAACSAVRFVAPGLKGEMIANNSVGRARRSRGAIVMFSGGTIALLADFVD